jgi:hypothetical protein
VFSKVQKLAFDLKTGNLSTRTGDRRISLCALAADMDNVGLAIIAEPPTDGCDVRLSLEQLDCCAWPSRVKFAIAIDKLHEWQVSMNLTQAGKAGISGSGGTERNSSI